MTVLLAVAVYLAVLFAVSALTSRHADNDTFFSARRQSPWYLVAFGMVGASISGVTFVSVPGMVLSSQMTYLQTCLGFILGYIVVATVLLPVFYRLRLTTIYSYLHTRLGTQAYTTGAAFFVLSKLAGAAVRFYIVCFLLHQYVVAQLGLPFALTVVVLVGAVWAYSRRGGIHTLVWTDTLQTAILFAALILIGWQVMDRLHLTLPQAVQAVEQSALSRVWVMDDWVSRQNFWKQFLSGAFIVIVMTGLDQDMMQKNLTCRSLRDAQKDMCTYGLAFLPANLLFLSLGVLLTLLAAQEGVPLPTRGDDLLPLFAATGVLGPAVVTLFTVGIMAACFSSADSALTALTTTACVDLWRRPTDERLRHRTHAFFAILFALAIIAFQAVHTASVIDTIYVLCAYTYGPLLGLFAFGLFTRRTVRGAAVPWVCVAAPLLCGALDAWSTAHTTYRWGYELLMLNGLLTFLGLMLCSKR